MMHKKIFGLMCFLALLLLESCGKTPNYKLERYDFFGYLNTMSYVYVEYDQNNKTTVEVTKEMNELAKVLVQVEKDFSVSRTVNMTEDSLLMKVNQNAGSFYPVSSDFETVLRKALWFSEISEGAFDPSVGALSALWDMSSKSAYCPKDYCDDPEMEYLCGIPSETSINTALGTVDFKKIEILDHQVKIPAGMKLDLGSIAKGFAADQVKEYLVSHGYTFGLINLGGNSLTFGTSVNNPVFDTSVVNPLGEGIVCNFYYYNGSVVTSGINERFYTYQGNYYHHLLSTSTGYPIDNSLASVTIITANSMTADGYSTMIFAIGLTEGLKLIQSTPGVDAIFVTKTYEVHSTIECQLTPGAIEDFALTIH